MQTLSVLNPLHHAVELIRGVVFGGLTLGDTTLHIAILFAFIVLMWSLACFQMRRRVVS